MLQSIEDSVEDSELEDALESESDESDEAIYANTVGFKNEVRETPKYPAE